MDDEIASHLEEAADDYVARGLSREEARLAAIRDFGGIAQAKEAHREVRAITWPDDVRQDVKYAVRRLCKDRSFTLIAAETMGFAGRYGGEEFCLLLPNVDAVRAREIGETVRSAVGELALPHATSNHQYVTVSVGVACTKPNDSQRPGDLIEAADAALYSAKHRGRNTVVEHGFLQAKDDNGDIAMARSAR